MDAMETLLTRRSVRKYKPDMVPKEVLEQIVRAGTFAPTGMNRQSPIILAVTNPELRNRLSRMNAAILSRDGDPFFGAPVVLVVLADRSACPTYRYDGSLVMGNLMLAAHALGLGSCWVHRAQQEFDSEEGKAILRELGIEGDYEGIGHCAVGFWEGEKPEPPARRDGRVFSA